MTAKNTHGENNVSYPNKSTVMSGINQRRFTGIVLIIVGSCLAIMTYLTTNLNNSESLIGIGLSAVILGLICIALPNRSMSPDAYQIEKINNRFLISLAIALCVVNVLLLIFNQNNISIYFVADTIIYLIVTLAYVSLSSRSKVILNDMATLFFVVFLVFVAFKIVEIMK